MVLELARRGRGGNAVALDPGGSWNDAELRFFSVSLRVSIALVRALRAFPDAQLHWFSRRGHFPQWDAPEETVRLIPRGTA